MKQVRRLFAFALTLFMALAIMPTAFAADTTTITIKNAANGETYTIYKILDATIDNTGGINYTGTIPSALADVLEVQTVGTSPNTYSAIGRKSGVTDEAYFAAIASYATGTATDTKIADASGKVTFNVAPGYYVVKSTQGTNVMVDSATDPAAEIYEKNTKTITADKKVDDTSYSIGDTITYTATFDTTNYYGTGETAKIVTSYEISDTLPEFLSDVTVTSIKIGDADYKTGTPATTPQFNADKKIIIPWAEKDTDTNEWTSLYSNGSKIVVVYTAKLTSVTNINAVDTNTVKIQPVLGEGTGTDERPWDDSWEKDAEITTYAAALKKVDENDGALAGAKFTIKGLTVDGANGVYTVVSYDESDDAAQSAQLDTDADGNLYIIGLADDVDLTVTEAAAPNGYNLLTSTVTLEPQLLSKAIYKENGEIHYDAKGNIVSQSSNATKTETVSKNLEDLNAQALKVENKKGTELPSTGGIGTTIFYVVGGVMVAGAAIFLLTKRRMAGNAE